MLNCVTLPNFFKIAQTAASNTVIHSNTSSTFKKRLDDFYIESGIWLSSCKLLSSCELSWVVTQLVTYLLTQSCLVTTFDDIYCHVPATEWCQRYLPCYLLSVFNSVCFSSMSVARQLQRRGLANVGRGKCPKINYVCVILFLFIFILN